MYLFSSSSKEFNSKSIEIEKTKMQYIFHLELILLLYVKDLK